MQFHTHIRIALPIILLTAGLFALFILLSHFLDQSFLLVIITMTILLCMLIPVIYLTIELPLLQIHQAIKLEKPAVLNKLRLSKSRFGQLASLVVEAFDQKQRLDTEILERIKLEISSITRDLQYRHLFETSQDAIICTDARGMITHCNKQAFAMFDDTDRTFLTGKKLGTCCADASSVNEHADIFNNPSGKKDLHYFECEMTRSGGDHFFAQIWLTPYCGEGNSFVAFFHLHDITAKKAAESDKKILEKHLHTITKIEAIGQLAGGIAHEYSNIFSALSGYADLIKCHYPLDARLQKYSSMMISATNRASQLTKKLLTFSNMNKPGMIHFNATHELSGIIDLFKSTLPDTVTCTCITDAPAETVLYGNVQQFGNAIITIAMNALDAMPDGGTITISTTISNSLLPHKIQCPVMVKPGCYFTIVISDTGRGMDSYTIEHLFEPFFTTKDKGPGAGLGLASVYGIIKSHNGHIDVKSALNKGSIFTLYFPVAAPPGIAVADSSSQAACVA